MNGLIEAVKSDLSSAFYAQNLELARVKMAVLAGMAANDENMSTIYAIIDEISHAKTFAQLEGVSGPIMTYLYN
jgi:hypothetical protein